MRFGPNSAKVTISRRPLDAANDRGDFADAWMTWASWRSVTGTRAVEAGLVEDQIGVVLRVHDSSRNQTISVADRIAFKGDSYAIASVAPRDRAGGFVEITLKRQIGG